MSNELWAEAISSKLSSSVKITNQAPTCSNQRDIKLVCNKRIKGLFKCNNCRKQWDSTQVTVEFTYGYKYMLKYGTVAIKSFGQSCQRCSPGKFTISKSWFILTCFYTIFKQHHLKKYIFLENIV